MYEPKLPVSGYPLAILAFAPFTSKVAIVLLIITCILVLFRFIRLLYKERKLTNVIFIMLILMIIGLSIYIYKNPYRYEIESNDINAMNISESSMKDEKKEESSLRLKSGDYIGTLKIEKLSLELDVLEDASDKNMFVGAGHIVGTPYPWESGNSFIASHNVKNYGLLFNRLHELKIGDEVVFTSPNESNVYNVYDVEIVDKDNVSCFDKANGDKNLSLVTCSNGKRLIIYCTEKYSSS